MVNYGNIGNATAGWYSRRLLRHATPDLVLERFSQRHQMPQNETQIIEFRRSNPFSPATTPLTEGVTPEPGDFSYETISARPPAVRDLYRDHRRRPGYGQGQGSARYL